MSEPGIPICDYEGSPWRTAFWPGREYEDRAERHALARLLPPRGTRLVEIGAGFGRLAPLYRGYDRVILLDYSRSLLREGRDLLGRDPRYTFVAADLYNLPLADGAVDTAVTVRVLHHVADLARALAQVARCLRPRGAYVMDFANKRHLKAVLQYGLRRGPPRPSPFSLEPYEFVRLNFDYHPKYIRQKLEQAGFRICAARGVSTFRLGALKRVIPPSLLAGLDGLVQRPAGALQVSPSLFLRAESCKPGAPEVNPALWRCLECSSTKIEERPAGLHCTNCGAQYPCVDGIYDLKRV